MFPAPGMRGKYGADIAIKGAALVRGLSVLRQAKLPRIGGPAYGIAVPLRFWSSWPEVGEGERAALSRRPFTFPHGDTGEADWFFHFWTKEVFHAVNYNRYKTQGDICR